MKARRKLAELEVPVELNRRSDCGHRLLMECPLTKEDWDVIFLAMLGFRHTCRIVSERAHRRAEAKAT